MTELKPCPFCGQTPDIDHPSTFQMPETSKYGCLVCCGAGPEVRTQYEDVEHWKQDAIDAWNERVDDKRVTELEGALEDALKLQSKRTGALLIASLVQILEKRAALHERRSKTMNRDTQVIMSHYIEECDAICKVIEDYGKENL